MESIFSVLEERCSGLQRIDTFGTVGPSVILDEKATGAIGPISDRSDEYILTGKVRVSFWANKAQRQTARRIAERQLAAALYGDFLSDLAKIAGAVSDGDRNAALSLLDGLREKIIR